MANPRITKYGERTKWHKPARNWDGPQFHGWNKLSEPDPVTGYDVFQLGQAFCRAMTPQERAETGRDCWVFMGNVSYPCEGSWLDITNWVRQEQGLSESQKPAPFFWEGKIPAEAWGVQSER